MSRQSSYSYAPHYASRQQELPKHLPTAHGTSSAFSANANPSDDWTKVSNLAERRRIQNRIAQRNYRKKLKKRLEDVEHSADLNSASSQQRPFELSRSGAVSSVYASSASGSVPRSTSSPLRRDDNLDAMVQTHVLPSPENRGMFSQQYTRQLSASSSPSFSYASLIGEDASANYTPYSEPNADSDMPPTMDIPSHPSFIPPKHQAHATGIAMPSIKQYFYTEDEFSLELRFDQRCRFEHHSPSIISERCSC